MTGADAIKKLREPTRRREQGTRVTNAKTPEERITAVRAIVAAGQYAKIDGVMVDLFSASAITAVYDRLNPSNQALYASKPVGLMARIAFRLLNGETTRG